MKSKLVSVLFSISFLFSCVKEKNEHFRREKVERTNLGEKISAPQSNLSGDKVTNEALEKNTVTEVVSGKIDQEAKFLDGGVDRFRQIFTDNFDQSAVEVENGTITTNVTFVVEKDGTISDVKALGSNKAFNREVVKAIRAVKGKWSPGKLKGESVRSKFRLPVTMQFQE